MTEPIHAIHVFGVHEPHGPGISMTFLNTLDPNRFQPVPIATPIDYGFPVPFDECTRQARAAVIEAIRAASGPVVLSGYSGGSLIQGDLARDIAAGVVQGIDYDQVAAVALLADPKRPEGAGATDIWTPPGYGIAGQRDIPGIPTLHGTASQDPIAALEADNPLRTVADLSPLWSADPLKAGAWAQDVMHTLIARQLQPWWMHPFRPAEQLGEAINALNGYLWQGHHTNDYLTQGICTGLAQVVNRELS